MSSKSLSLLCVFVSVLSFTASAFAAVPVANAGFAQTLAVGSTAQLDGTASYNPTGTRLTYLWSFVSIPSGSNASLSSTTSPRPTFVIDKAGSYTVQLVVNNGVNSGPSTVVISTANSAPIANAGLDDFAKGVGARIQLDGSYSTDADGNPLTYTWLITSKPTGSAATLSSTTIVNPTFKVDVAGTYVVQLQVSDGHIYSAPSTVTVSTASSFPYAYAGPPQIVTAAQTVQLDGGGSTSIGGSMMTYSWSILYAPQGSLATLSSPTSVRTTFGVDAVGIYVVQLMVTESSLKSFSTVVITNTGLPPVANAGPDQVDAIGTLIDLGGGDSTDTDGNPLTFHWDLASRPAGSTAALSSPLSEYPYFTIDKAGEYVAQLIVNDGISSSQPSTVRISTVATTPIAVAGTNQTVLVGSTAQLSGASSHDAVGDSLNYVWTLLSIPSGSKAALSNKQIVNPTFVADKTGIYVLQLVVSNSYCSSRPVTVEITAAQNQAPVVNAGPNQTITLPTNRVTLDGTATDDGLPNGTLIVSWTQLSGPGATTFTSPTTAITDAIFSLAGVYVLQLTANDTQLSTSATVTVTVNNTSVAATLSAVQSTTVAVGSSSGPWSLAGGLNSSYVYGNSGTSAPVTFPVTPGEQVSLQYLSGQVSIGIAAPGTDAAGWSGERANFFGEPAFYQPTPAFGGSLIGAWTDATGQLVAPPFMVNDGVTAIAPFGAVQLQLGVSDNYYNDNAGGWSISIQAGMSQLAVGPNITGTSQTLTAYITEGGVPVANGSVQFTVTGANSATSTVTTNSYGVASFTYTGAKQGADTVQATFGAYPTNTVGVSWTTPVNTISSSTSLGKFFASDGSCTFDTAKTATPAFTQEFPSITFNPPPTFVHGNSNISYYTVPFTDVTTDQSGNFTGTIVAQGNGYQAGLGPMSTAFQAEFGGSFVVSQAGNLSLDMIDDGGFILGIGGGAIRLSGILVGSPASGVTPFQSLPVMGAYNAAVTSGPENNVVTVNFPAAGTYPFELDYTECNGSSQVPMTLTMGVGSNSSTATPPSGSLSITPTNPPPIQVGQTQTFTVTAVDASGLPIPNLAVLSNLYGANQEFLSGTTNASGQATLQYTGLNAGTDVVQVISHVNNSVGVSNVVTVTWTGSTGTTYVFTPQGWISSPLLGTVAQNQIPITLVSGVTLTSGTLKYFPTSNPSQITVLNSNTTGTGPLTIGTFDATLLANGQYTIQLQATASNGTSQLNEIVLSVTGEYKPGRETVMVTDFKIPLAGIPISITRTYDSLNRGVVQDFGNGWSLGSNVQLSVDLMMNVTFTLNGKRQTFNFTPQSSGNALFPWLVTPFYTPQPGLHGSLTSNGCTALIYSGGALVQDQAGVVCFPGGTYQPTVYTYTDPAGRVYTISSSGQLQTIKDLNGNTLTFTPNGIASSVGNNVSVPFVRDSQGRITTITDLNGNNYSYTYDSPCGTGNLCTVAYPGINTPAAYTYTSDHSLQTRTDPNNNTWVNTYYTDPADNGRLQSVTSPYVMGANGNPTQFVTQYSYTVATNSTTTTNPDGGIVTETDDSFGNPLTIVDAVNNKKTYTYNPNETVATYVDPLQNPATKFTYDTNGFQISVTDPLNHKTTFIYNQYGGLMLTTDAAQQNTTTLSYDPFFNPTTATDTLGQLWTRTYDSMGNVLTQADANGYVTQFTYDTRGNLLTIVDPLNEVTTFTYDNMDRVLSMTDPRQNETSYSYDALGNLTDTTDAVGHVWRSTYDLNGNKTSGIDPLGRITSYAYDALNRMTTITYADKTTKSYTYDFRNNKLSETDQSGRVNQYVYYLDGELKSVTYALGTPDAGTVQYTYDADDNTKTVKDELNNSTTYFYDAANNFTEVQDALQDLTYHGYDADNRPWYNVDANGHWTYFSPDARGRLLTTTFNDQTTDKYTWDGVGNQLTATDQALNKTTRNYDQVNRLLKVTDPLSNVTQYGYDPAGNLLSITDANSHVTSFQYDSLNHKILRDLPLGMGETFSHDAVGNLSAKTDFNGKTTTYSYDSLNRLLQKVPDPTLSEPTISFTYNPTGTRLSMTDASGTTSYTSYDNRNRLKTEVTPEGTLSYTYDAHSNLLTLASSNTNGASVTYTPDPLNRVGKVTDNRLIAQGVASAITTYSYYPVGTVHNYTYSTNSVQTAYAYDTLNRLTSIGSTKGTTGLSSFAYTPYPAGNVQTVTELSGRTVNYGYDTDYHLKSETISADPGGNNGAENYTYDFVGNRKTLASTIPSLPGSISYNYDTNDRLTTDTYDNAGNTLSSAGTASTYDFENRMLTHGSVSMVYDGDGYRVSETAGGATTKYLIDTLNPTGYAQVLDELVSGAVTKTYTYGLQRISENQLVGSTWTPSFYGYDGHGNVRFLTSTTGAVGNTYQFDAFGMPIASAGTTANIYLYSGERFDQNIGLYHLRARYYNQATGRFETMDPRLGQIFNPGTLHKYVYTRNNPVNLVDPGGTEAGEEAAIEFDIQNLTTSVRRIASKLQLTNTAVGCAIHALKADLAGQFEGNPDILVDVTNGNAFLPVSYEFVGCILHYLPEAEAE